MSPRVPPKISFVTGFPFLFLALTLLVLSLVPLPDGAQFLLCCFGLVVPLSLMLEKAGKGGAPLYLKESLQLSNPWLWVLPVLAALLLRFWKLKSLLVWPQADEGFSGIAGIELSRNWTWRFFYSDGQSPPVLDWICSLFFRATDDYFLNLWFPPVIFSVLTLGLGYFAARQFFSRSFSWFFAGLVAFCFWPLYLGRLCLQVVMFPPWEMAAFWALGSYLKALPEKREKQAVILGLVTGLGAYTYVPWVFLPLLFSGVLLFDKRFSFRERFQTFLTFGVSLCAGAFFFLRACVQEGYGDHISALWAGKPSFSWMHHLSVIFDYFNILFWGFVGEIPRYVPFQGGYLNPLLGALFFLGVVEAWRLRKESLIRVLAAAFVLFLLPGVLSADVQGLRIVPLMPLALVVCVLGFFRLTGGWGESRRLWVAAFLFLATAGFDFYRLVQPYLNLAHSDANFRRIDKNPSLFYAYRILENKAALSGPGLVFTDFTPERDQTLRGAVYPFNAAWKSELGPGPWKWAALLLEVEDEPLVRASLPEATWTELGAGADGKGALELGMVPVTPQTEVLLNAWTGEVFHYFQDLSSAMNEVKNQETYDKAQELFNHPPPQVTTDLFLRVCWGRRTQEFYHHFGRH